MKGENVKKKRGEKEENGVVYEDEESEAPSAQLKKLKDMLADCKKEKQEYLSGWQRARADLVNERMASEKRSRQISELAQEEIISDLMPILDSFDMAFANKEAWGKVDKNWRIGVENIHSNIISVLSKLSIAPFDPLSDVFNPKEHESIDTVSTKDKKRDNKIVEVLQKGYKRGEKILRPAKVKIAVYETET